MRVLGLRSHALVGHDECEDPRCGWAREKALKGGVPERRASGSWACLFLVWLALLCLSDEQRSLEWPHSDWARRGQCT